MKKLSLFALAAAGMLFGACSSNDDVVDAVVNPAEFTDGAFIGISLSLPSADATTRANDDLSNGTEDEFAVKNATLYIFKLAANSQANPDEAATYVDKISLGNTYDPDKMGGINPDEWGIQEGVDETKITSTYNQATLIPNELASQMKADTQNKYYAYVIINHNGVVTAPSETTTFKQFCDQEFAVIGADIAAEKNIWETGLLMTNAPICNVAGGQAAPASPTYSTLVQLDNTKIFGSKAEAEGSPAACVYVERAAVKITVEDNRTDDGKKIGDLDVTIQGWQVINNEPKYYNTRHINNDGAAAEDWGPYKNDDCTRANNLYRFVSLYPFAPTKPGTTGHTTGYRTYFATDLQYNKDATLENTVASDDRPWIAVGKQHHAYTTENTFDVAHQTWQNTTMVTLKVQIGDGTQGFYTVGKGSQVMYANDATGTADAKTGEEKAAAAIENFLKGDNDVASAMTALRAKISDNNKNVTITSGLTVTFTTPTASKTGVEYTVTLDFKKGTAAYTTFDGDGEAALKTALENAIKTVMYSNPDETDPTKLEFADPLLLSYYKGGVSYYNVRIKHFDDVETPWSATGDHIYGGGDGVNEIYFGIAKDATPTAAQTTTAQSLFLGRYGVVRDNWYKLSVDKIGKIGDAEPVDPSTTTPDTPDDEIENFISVHVHIVPWVLREQSVQF